MNTTVELDTIKEEAQFDPRIFTPEVLDLLNENGFQINTIPPKDIFDKSSTATAIAMDLWNVGYTFTNEKLNRVVFIKSNPNFENPAIGIDFGFLDTYQGFEKERDMQLWKLLFTETRECPIEEKIKFGRFLKQYLLLMNESEIEVFVEVLDEWRKTKYERYLLSEQGSTPRFPHPELFHISESKTL